MTEVSGVGEELRQAREAQGLAVIDVAQQLKFAPRQIESLEAERFDRLPGPTIARGMVRNYARLLKLDAEPLLARMAAYGEVPAGPEELAARFGRAVPFSDNAGRSTFVYVGFSAAVLLLVGALAYEWQQERAAPQFVAPVASQPAPVLEPAPQSATATQLPQVVFEPPSVPEPAPNPAPPMEESAKKPAPALAPQRALEPAEAEPEPQPEPQLAAVAQKPQMEEPEAVVEKPPAAGLRHVVLRCEEEAWLEVRGAEARALLASLTPGGSERVVRAPGPLRLVIGNAQHVRLIVDGKPVDLKPHTRGQVARLTLP